MVANKEASGTITLPTQSAAALWSQEITGQLSDGMWENSRPHDHWKFWCNLVVEVDPGVAQVTTSVPWRCTKKSYNLNGLLPFVGDRMVNIGRMGTVTRDVVRTVAEFMPATLAEWTECKVSGKWQHEHIADRMNSVSSETATAYYASTYDLKLLKRDLAAIKAAMKSVR